MAEKTKEELEQELQDVKNQNEQEEVETNEKVGKFDEEEIEKLKGQIRENSQREIQLEKEKMQKEMEEIKAQLEAFKQTTMTDKQKEEQSKLLKEQSEQDERARLLDEIEKLKESQKKEKLEKTIISKITKEPYLKGHIEHVQSEDELNALVKREGESWKKLYTYENSNNKRNRNVTSGYNISNPVSAGKADYENKVKSWQETITKFLPKHGRK